MSEKILLIDGHSLLNRTYYGLPDMTNAEGLHTNAIYGFLNILFKLLEEEKPDYLTVAFDTHAPTFRHQIFDAYKGTRHAMPDELREQVPVMQEVLGAMGVRIVRQEGLEADDILGTIAGMGERAGMDVTILSGDRDLLQLVTDKVLVRIPKTKSGQTSIYNYHPQEVLDEYGLTPLQIIELKALMGDSSDNIPGLPGVGIKTATKILQQYETIENAHAHLEEIKPRKAMEAMRDHWDLAVLSKDLATIRVDSDLTYDFADARMRDFYTPEAYTLFKRLNFTSFLPRFEAGAGGKEKLSVVLCRDLADAEQLFANAETADEIGIHVLTEEEAHSGIVTIIGAALSWGRAETCYIPAEGFITDAYLREKLSRTAAAAGRVSVYGLKDLLKAVSIEERDEVEDIQIAAYLLNPLTADYPFDVIAGKYVSDVLLLSAEEIFGGKKIPSPSAMDEEKAAVYAGEIAFAAYASRKGLEQELETAGMTELYRQIEMPLVYTLHGMEHAGIRVLPEELDAYSRNLEGSIAGLEQRIYEQAGETFNINSPKQLGVILFEKMQLPGGKKTKTGYSTAADVLEKLAADAPVVRDILEYRQLTKLKSTYADGLANFIRADGRIHTTFKQTITATGRLSSTDPNLQNIPVRMELGRQIRKVFVPEDGFVFIDADYSQIELRVLASMSGDTKLIDAYRQAKDIHAITASQVFHVPFEEVTPLMRRNAKAVNFGIVYGISSFGLSEDLGISRKEAAAYIERYYETYPGIRDFLENLVTEAKKTGYSQTIYGRRRPMPELTATNFMQRQFGERVAKNAPIQGTAADIIKIAMNRVDQRLKKEKLKSRLLIQVHDELLIEAAEDEAAIVKQILEEEMTGAADLAVKLEIDVHSGKSWYEAK